MTVIGPFDLYLFMQRLNLGSCQMDNICFQPSANQRFHLLLVFEWCGAVSCYTVWFFVVHGLWGGGVVVVVDVMMVVLNGVPVNVMETVCCESCA